MRVMSRTSVHVRCCSRRCCTCSHPRVRSQAFADKNEKVGEIISSEHRSYELMLDLQLGIRWSVSLYTPPPAPKTSDSADLGPIAHKVKARHQAEHSMLLRKCLVVAADQALLLLLRYAV